MNSFVLFPQALEPSMNFNISKMEYSAIHCLSAPTILYLVCTSKFCITFVFNFFCGTTVIPGEKKDIHRDYAKI